MSFGTKLLKIMTGCDTLEYIFMKGRLSAMKTKGNIKKAVMKVLAGAAYNSAVNDANTACIFWQYQPKASAKVKKLRKF